MGETSGSIGVPTRSLPGSFNLLHDIGSAQTSLHCFLPSPIPLPIIDAMLHIPALPDPLLHEETLSVEKGKGVPVDDNATDQDVLSATSRPKSLPPPSLQGDSALVPPTSARSLVRQSSRSFAARNKDSPPVVPAVVPGSSANQIVTPSDLDCYTLVGMTAPAATETAHHARIRHNANETHIAVFLASLESNINSQDRVHRDRLEEVLLLVNEIRGTSLVDNPVIKQLHTALVEDRDRITELVSAVHRVEKAVTAKVPEDRPLPVPPLPSIPSSPPHVSRRPLEDPSMPAPKRLRSSGRSYVDVLYGPVDCDGIPSAIANAAMELTRGLQPSDVFSAQFVPGQPGIISIRFRDYTKADRFMTAIEEKPLLQGQTAIRAMDAAPFGLRSGRNQGPTPSPLDIIRGVGKSTRRR